MKRIKGLSIIRNKRIVAIFLITWSFAMFLAFADNFLPTRPKPTGKWITVSHPLYGFSLTYPDKWYPRLYNENGYRGNHELKLELHERYNYGFGGIFVERVEAESPTLEDATVWDAQRLAKLGRQAKNRGESGYRNSTLEEDQIKGTPLLRRRYELRDWQFEAVYIARANDFIIITLATKPDYYDKFKEDFDRVVESFEPLE